MSNTKYTAIPLTPPAGRLVRGKVIQYQWFNVGQEGTDPRWWVETTGFGDTEEARKQDAIAAARNA